MAINPIGLALGAANPGLLPLAFSGNGGGGGGSYDEGGCIGPIVALLIVISVLCLGLYLNWKVTLLIAGGLSYVATAIYVSFTVGTRSDDLLIALMSTFALLISFGAFPFLVMAVIK